MTGAIDVPHQLLPLVYKMMGHSAGLLAAGWAVAIVRFTDRITLGSIITTCVVLAIAGLITIRSRIAAIWREEAEGERAAKERCHEELAEERASRAEFDKQQQELRHELKDQIAGLKGQLKVMEAKTDLDKALEAIRQMNEATVSAISAAITETFVQRSQEQHSETHRLLTEIRDKLPAEPIAVDLLHQQPE